MRERKKRWKRFLAGMLSGVMLAGTVGGELPVATVDAAGENVAAGEISVNPQIHYQTLKGWGSSLCWWGNVIGSWGDQDFNENGKPDREEIAELAFSPDYLNLNIVRYNVGGGDKEDTSIKRVEGLVPGWTVDMTGKSDGTGTFDAETFYNKKTEDMNDAGQLWMLEQANKWRKDTAEKNGTENDIINEVFSNSPPYYMTKSGSSTGGVNAASNLKTDKYDDFALYMARAAKWIDSDLNKKYGAHVDYIEPMNEPDTNYWGNGSTKQEGCVFKPGAEQSNMLLAMQRALKAQEFGGSLDGIEITGTDETALSNAINSFKNLTAEAKNSMTTIGAHTYSGNDSERHTLRKLAKSYDKELWMSEITKGGGKHDHASMTEAQTKSQSEGIMADLKYMQPSAWVAWLVADSEYECLKHDENWGLIHCVFESDGPVPDYHTNLINSNGSKKKGVPDEGYWVVTKQFYTMMQYSKYLKAGYTMIDIGDDNMCAALSPDGTELVIVAQNFSGERSTTVDLSAFQERGEAKVYRTSDEKNCELVDTQNVADGILNVTLPANSVSTYVIEVKADMNNFKEIVEADVTKPSDTGVEVSDLNKFTYTGTWKDQSTTDKNATAVFTFEGTRAVVYAAKGAKGTIVNVSVDGGAPQQVSLYDETEMPEAILCDTGKLAEGKHTIQVSIDESVTADNGTMKGTSLTLSHAEIISGDVSLAGKATIRKVSAYDGALSITFDAVSGSGNYTIKYGTSEQNLDQFVTTVTNSAVIKGLTNGTKYYIQVEDSFGNVSNVAAGTPKVPEGKVLYFVDAGTSNLYSPASDEQFGRFNSILDQAYGKDAVSGKNWGYIGESQAYYTTDDRWTSVRERSEGMEYQFDLPQGTYMVTVAMKDPWNNGGRYTDLIINGETKDSKLVPGNGISKTYKTVMAEDGTLSVKAVKSSGNSNNNPMISFILVSEFDPEDTTVTGIPEQTVISTVNGVIPHLPKTIKADTMGGTTVEKEVVWEAVKAAQFTGADFTTTVVKGTAVIDGTEYEIKQTVQIVPENVQYFIDCGWADSTQYAGLKDAAGLKNDAADKKYTNGSWGYLMQANAYGATTTNESGWYDPVGDKIQYKIPMDAGDYAVTFGFHDWWYGDFEKRPMILKAYIGDAATELGTCGTKSDPKTFNVTKDLKVSQKADVTLSVERGNQDAPILSWIAIQGKSEADRSSLKEQLNQAGVLNRADYSEQSFAALDTAAAAGMEQLIRAGATQTSVDQAAAAIEDAIGKLDVSTVNRENLQKEVDAAKKLDITSYTVETTEVFSKALTDAENLLKKTSISRTELEAVREALLKAVDGLQIKPENKPVEELKEELGVWIYRAKNLTSILYTEASWAAMQTKLSEAQTVYGNTSSNASALATALTNLQKAVAALEKVSAGDDSKDELGNYQVMISKDKLVKNDYVLYTANCGTPEPLEVPGGEKLGLLQSNVDQEYGADPKTGAVWGCAPADQNSAAVKGGNDADDTGASYIYMSDTVTFDKEKSGLRYAFETLSAADNFDGILKNIYEVTLSFKNPWSDRDVNISLEGQEVESGLTLGQNAWVSKTYRVKVTDGELNVLVNNPNRTSTSQDPLINCISVKAVTGNPDTTKLSEAVKAAKAFEGKEKEYTKESWSVFDQAYKKAKAMLEKPGNDQDALDQCADALTAAVNGLKKAEEQPDPVVKVKSVSVSGSIKKLAKGKTATLKAAVLPSNAANKSVKWKSSNTKIATVTSKGVVTGKSKGTATITATAQDGSKVEGTYKIIVVSHAVKKITLKSNTKGIAAGKKVTLKTTVSTTGKTANKTLSYSSSNKKYATVNSKGVVTTKKAGAGKTVTITAKATDGTGKRATVKVKILKHAVKKITLKCSKTLKAGKKVKVKATVKTTGKTANKTLTYSSSNKKYATVNSKGMVTAKKAGKGKTVTITAKATDGTNKKATVKIKIK